MPMGQGQTKKGVFLKYFRAGSTAEVKSCSCAFKHKLREEFWRKWEEFHGKKGGEGKGGEGRGEGKKSIYIEFSRLVLSLVWHSHLDTAFNRRLV